MTFKNRCAIRHTFKAYERLKREQHIDTLFRTGKAFSILPVKFIYLSVPRQEGELSPVRAVFSIPKRKFRKAVDRNRIRRMLKEAWRLNKQMLYTAVPPGVQLHVFLIFTGPVIPGYQTVLETIVKGMDRLSTVMTSITHE